MSLKSAVILMAITIAMISCTEPATPDSSATPDTPANQRYWLDVGGFAVVHWDASPDAHSYEVYYGTCPDESRSYNDCISAGKTSSTSAAICLDQFGSFEGNCHYTSHSDFSKESGIWVVACNSRRCAKMDVANPAQRLPGPEGPIVSPPGGFEGKKIRRDLNPDTATLTWNAVDAATYFEIWIRRSGPSSSFRLGSTIEGLGLRAQRTSYTPEEHHILPFYYGTGPYELTSWKVRACNKAGCSSFTPVITIE